jgi:PPOX class probable F420-dependent enzyme
MVDFSSPLAKKIANRLQEDSIIWLTTVDAQSTPQPRPVWFHWDGETILIFSQKQAAKVRHIGRNHHVALNFNTDPDGDNVCVIIGDAYILQEPLPAERLQDYMNKYGERIRGMGMTSETMQTEYPIMILVTPKALRGF